MLLSDLLVHSSQRIVLSSEVTSEGSSGALHQLLNTNTLLLGDSRREAKAIDGASDTDPGRVNWNIRGNVAINLGSIHVRSVLGVRRDSMVLLDDWIKYRGKVLVGVPVSSIDTTVLVIKFNSTGNSLNEGESRGLGFDSLQLLPLILGDMRGNKRMFGLNVGEWSIGLSRHSPVHFNSTSGLQFLVFLPELVDSVDHLLDKLNLRVSQPVLGPSWEVNMHGSSHASTKIGWAGMDVTVFGVETEVLSRLLFDGVTNSLDASGESLKDTLDISTLLHGNDSELIFFIDPDKESLGSIVEDASTLRPVSLHTSNSEVSVSRDKEEVVVDKLLSDLLVHSSQRIVLSSEVSSEGSSGTLHQLLNTKTLLLGDSRREAKAIDGTSDTDPGRVNWNT